MDRTNNTLSATTNRLNLGARSLTPFAAVQDSLRQRPVHPFREDVMPDGIHDPVRVIRGAYSRGSAAKWLKPSVAPSVVACRPAGEWLSAESALPRS